MKETVSDDVCEVQWGVRSKSKVRVLKRAISDFQRGPGCWTEDNRQDGLTTSRRM